MEIINKTKQNSDFLCPSFYIICTGLKIRESCAEGIFVLIVSV
jgi:hypothetical protein